MSNDLAAALAAIVVLIIVVAYIFIGNVWADLTATAGHPMGMPAEISAIVLLGACGAGILVYMNKK